LRHGAGSVLLEPFRQHFALRLGFPSRSGFD
jgi:hypothetical protein